MQATSGVVLRERFDKAAYADRIHAPYPPRVPLVISRILHAKSQENRRQVHHCEGAAIYAEVAKEMRQIDGVSGVHIMAPLNEVAIPRVIERIRG